jgi:hypothetical protein
MASPNLLAIVLELKCRGILKNQVIKWVVLGKPQKKPVSVLGNELFYKLKINIYRYKH